MANKLTYNTTSIQKKTETCPADQIIRFTTSLIFHYK